MRVLLADPDRDMLFAYRRLMELAGHAAKTAFDGVRVLDILETASFDLAVVSERLPRIAHERVMRSLIGKGVPAVVLLDAPVSVKRLCRKELANAYLSYPFSPAELFALAADALDKANAGKEAVCMGLRVDVRGFRFSGTDIRLTAGEMDALMQLAGQGTPLPFEKLVYAHSLNRKLEKLDSPRMRVEYLENQGYRLVNLE
ncbi:MAG: response regulator transcription factor [Oscillospiraceae bacterium]|nr:response regulator transcription factor [Oscillospiraceae bacterium]